MVQDNCLEMAGNLDLSWSMRMETSDNVQPRDVRCSAHLPAVHHRLTLAGRESASVQAA